MHWPETCCWFHLTKRRSIFFLQLIPTTAFTLFFLCFCHCFAHCKVFVNQLVFVCVFSCSLCVCLFLALFVCSSQFQHMVLLQCVCVAGRCVCRSPRPRQLDSMSSLLLSTIVSLNIGCAATAFTLYMNIEHVNM